MTHKEIHGWITVIISGIALYVLNLICSMLPYVPVSTHTFFAVFSVTIVIGAAIILVLVFKNREKFRETLLRLILSFISVVGLVIINGHIGTVRILHQVLGFNPNSSADNASGMLSLTFFAIMTAVCIVSLLISSVISVFQKRIDKK